MREPGIPRCERCGYDLSGLKPEQEPRCPECGEVQSSFFDQEVLSARMLMLRMIGPFLAFYALFVLFGVAARIWRGDFPMLAMSMIMIPLLAALILGPLAWFMLHEDRRRPDGVRRSRADIAKLVLLAYVTEVALLIGAFMLL